MLLGALVALPCYGVIAYRTRTRVDETLDVLAAHGIAGFTGILFIGFFAQLSWNGVSDGLLFGNAAQLADQVMAAVAAPAYAFGATYLLLRLIGLFIPLRATESEEALGMDVVYHGEEAYATGEGAILVTPGGGRRFRARWSPTPPSESAANAPDRLHQEPPSGEQHQDGEHHQRNCSPDEDEAIAGVAGLIETGLTARARRRSGERGEQHGAAETDSENQPSVREPPHLPQYEARPRPSSLLRRVDPSRRP